MREVVLHAPQPSEDRMDRCLQKKAQEGSRRGGIQEKNATNGQVPSGHPGSDTRVHLAEEEPEAGSPEGPARAGDKVGS